jgi:hypothetical protein
MTTIRWIVDYINLKQNNTYCILYWSIDHNNLKQNKI